MTELLYVRDGALIHRDGEVETPYRSAFAQEMEAQDRKSWENNAWKAGRDDDPGAVVSRSMLWGSKGNRRPPQPLKIGHAVHAGRRWYYTLVMSHATGLFYYDTETKEEIRLFHRQGFASSPFCVLPDGRLVVTTTRSDGSTALTLLDASGVEREHLTEGDSLDQNPSFHDGWVYFNSIGLGRNSDGIVLAHAHSAVGRLGLESGEVEFLLDDEKFDYLLPRCTPGGVLYALRMPHRAAHKTSPWQHVKDVALFPVRLVVALFGFLNVFSTFFGKQPLTTAGGPDSTEDARQRLLHQRLIDVERESRQAGEKVAAPESWELVRVTDGKTQVVARRVCTFDIAGETVIYSRGYDLCVVGEPAHHKGSELITSLSGADLKNV